MNSASPFLVFFSSHNSAVYNHFVNNLHENILSKLCKSVQISIGIIFSALEAAEPHPDGGPAQALPPTGPQPGEAEQASRRRSSRLRGQPPSAALGAPPASPPPSSTAASPSTPPVQLLPPALPGLPAIPAADVTPPSPVAGPSKTSPTTPPR